MCCSPIRGLNRGLIAYIYHSLEDYYTLSVLNLTITSNIIKPKTQYRIEIRFETKLFEISHWLSTLGSQTLAALWVANTQDI